MARKKSKKKGPAPGTPPAPRAAHSELVARHLRWGWWMLLAFLSLGLGLEALHGFKVDAYLGVDNATRRLMWTLAHTHGTLLGLVHLAFAVTLRLEESPREGSPLHLASRGLIVAGLLLPAGFFLGGLVFHEGDPGLGVLLVPLGGILLLASVFLVARHVSRGA